VVWESECSKRTRTREVDRVQRIKIKDFSIRAGFEEIKSSLPNAMATQKSADGSHGAVTDIWCIRGRGGICCARGSVVLSFGFFPYKSKCNRRRELY
jgi:hypothetical protein